MKTNLTIKFIPKVLLAALLIFSFSASFNLAAKELHYLVEVNNTPKGMLIIKTAKQNSVEFLNVSSADNLIFYTQQQDFELAASSKYINYPSSLANLVVNNESYQIIYDLPTQNQLNLFKLAQIADADKNSRTFILNSNKQVEYNFPTLPVVNTPSLLTSLATSNINQQQQVYFFEPGNNRFLRTLLNKAKNVEYNSCSAKEILLSLNEEGKNEFPLINFVISNNLVQQAASASGSWNLKLLAAGTSKNTALNIQEDIVKLGLDELKAVKPKLEIINKDIKNVANTYILQNTASLNLTNAELTRIAAKELNTTSSLINLTTSTNSLGFTQALTPICSGYTKQLAEKLTQELVLQIENNLKTKVKTKQTAKASSACETLELDLTITGKNLDNAAKLNTSFNSALQGFSRSFNLKDGLNLTIEDKKVSTKLSLSLTQEGLLSYFAQQMQVPVNLRKGFISNIIVVNNNLSSQVDLNTLAQLACEAASNEINAKVRTAKAKPVSSSTTSCNIEISQQLSATSTNNAILNDFKAKNTNLVMQGINPVINNFSLNFEGVYGIEGAANACQN